MVRIAIAGNWNIELPHKIGHFLEQQNVFLRYFNNSCPMTIAKLKEWDLDYVFCIHYHPIIPKEFLAIPKHGFINLHPAYLPYCRGWHTPSWMIYENTWAGATLHFMDEQIDHGDIIHRKKIEELPEDTADSLYKRVMDLEFEVFKEAWPSLRDFTYTRMEQHNVGSSHKKTDLATIQNLNIGYEPKVAGTIRLLRTLTTNDVREAAYFIENGKRYYCQIKITKEEDIK